MSKTDRRPEFSFRTMGTIRYLWLNRTSSKIAHRLELALHNAGTYFFVAALSGGTGLRLPAAPLFFLLLPYTERLPLLNEFAEVCNLLR